MEYIKMPVPTDKLPLVCVDIETTGLKLTDDIISISLRSLKPDGTPTDEEYYSLIWTDQEICVESYKTNGISKETLSSAPSKDQVIEGIITWWRDTFHGSKVSPVGHNFLGFDKPRVEKFLGPRYNEIFHYHSDDSMVIARALQRAGLLPVMSCSLKVLAEFFDIECERAHHASIDTYMCGMVYSRLLKILTPSLSTRIVRVFNPYYLGVHTNSNLNTRE